MSMKKTLVIVVFLIFAAAMFHYFYGEGHGSVRLPSAGIAFGSVHHDHGYASTCLCFTNALFVPEPDAWDGATDFRIPLALADESRLFASLGADIAHPPNSLFV